MYTYLKKTRLRDGFVDSCDGDLIVSVLAFHSQLLMDRVITRVVVLIYSVKLYEKIQKEECIFKDGNLKPILRAT